MNSQTLNFEITINHNRFEVEYESEGPENNLIISILFHDFYLDISELIYSHLKVFIEIKNTMLNNADTYWSEKSKILN